MAKDPSFPFYAQDFLVDTLRWDREMKSLHVDLLAESWINGPLKDVNHGLTPVEPRHPFGLTTADVVIWKRIADKWVYAGGFWHNERLEEAREKRKIFKQIQKNKAKLSVESRKNKKVKPRLNRGSTGVEPLEKENEKEYIKENNNKGGKGGIDIEHRKTGFCLQVDAEGASYSSGMRRAFCDYWTEKNAQGKKMRFEMQQVFDIPKRLARWHQNEQTRFTGKNEQNKHVTISEKLHGTKSGKISW